MNGFHLTAGDKDYKERLEQIEEGVKAYYNANGIPPGEPTMKGSNADPYVADDSKPLGQRSLQTEIKTRAVSYFSLDTAKPFAIRYGYSKNNLI